MEGLGRDIDGLTTVATSSSAPDLAQVCKRRQGAPSTIHNDGNAGIDNAWGKKVMKLLSPFAESPSTIMTAEIFGGARTGMSSLDGKSGSFVIAEKVASQPSFDAMEVRAVAADSMSNGTPKALIVDGGVTANGVYDSGPLTGELLVAIFPEVLVPLRAARITMTIAPDGERAKLGTISGVVETEILVDAIAKAADA